MELRVQTRPSSQPQHPPCNLFTDGGLVDGLGSYGVTYLDRELSGPVGMKQFRLVSEGAEIRIFKDGHWQSLDSAEQALQEQLGWSLPLQYLPWWLRGLPAPQLRPDELDISAGRLRSLRQAGWTVEYPDYQVINTHTLPRTILFRREQVEGKILLKQWTLGP